MDLINNNFVRISRSDMFNILLKMSNDDVFEETRVLLLKLLSYEASNDEYAHDIYFSVDSKFVKTLVGHYPLCIKRQTLLNSCFHAARLNEYDILFKLGMLLPMFEVPLDNMGDLSDFVLTHSINPNEYFDGEKDRIIYDDVVKSFKRAFIYGNFEGEKTLNKC